MCVTCTYQKYVLTLLQTSRQPCDISRHLSSSLVTSECIVAQHGKERQREATRGKERVG